MTVSLAELLDELREIFGSRLDQEEGPSAARLRQVNALSTIVDFVESAGLERSYCNEIAQLSNALLDLDVGRVAPLLQPAAVHSRPPDTSDVWLGRAQVAIVFELLTRTGHKRKSAIEFIADRQEHLQHLMTKKAESAGTAAANWHWQLKEAQAGSPMASQAFSRGMQTLDGIVETGVDAKGAERVADRMLKESGLISLSVTPK